MLDIKKRKFILLIDDDPISNYLTERLLDKLQIAHRIEEARNGYEGLEIINDHCSKGHSCPDLILLDINMPVMNGIEFLQLFRKRNFKDSEKADIAVLSTSTHHKDYHEIMSYGVKHILQKPLTESKLQKVWD